MIADPERNRNRNDPPIPRKRPTRRSSAARNLSRAPFADESSGCRSAVRCPASSSSPSSSTQRGASVAGKARQRQGLETTLLEDLVPDLIETVENGIATLTLNRPERLNALSMDIRSGLLEALERLGHDNNVGCIVLTGAGRAFCAGGDVKSMGERPRPVSNRAPLGSVLQPDPDADADTSRRPIIAMVNGVAVGAGLSMALACDLRVAAQIGALRHRVSEDRPVRRLGRNLDADPAGRHRQGARALSVGRYDHRGRGTGLRHGQPGRGRRRPVAHRRWRSPVGSRICRQIAVGYAKRNLHAAETGDLQTVLDMEAFNQARCSQTEDHREAVRAFAEKREACVSRSMTGTREICP